MEEKQILKPEQIIDADYTKNIGVGDFVLENRNEEESKVCESCE